MELFFIFIYDIQQQTLQDILIYSQTRVLAEYILLIPSLFSFVDRILYDFYLIPEFDHHANYVLKYDFKLIWKILEAKVYIFSKTQCIDICHPNASGNSLITETELHINNKPEL